jgi:PAS domain S-box-containing protein
MREIFLTFVANPSSHWLRAVVSFSPLLKLLAAPTFVTSLFAVLRRKKINRPATQSEQLFSAFIDNLPTALQASEERFRAQYKGIPVPTFSWQRLDEDFVLIDFNDAAEEFTHQKIAKLIGSKASDLYADRPDIVRDMRRCFNRRCAIRREMQYQLLTTGEIKYLDTSFVFVPRDLVMIHVEDITGRKAAEQAQREAERKYHDIFENAAEGIFQTTSEGQSIAANPAMARMLGFDSPEEMIRERTDIAQQEYVDPAQREEFKRLLNEHDVVQRFEYEAYRKDRSKIWLSESVRAVRDENRKLLYYEGITEDITERKRAEETLLASERRYRDIFTLAPVGIYQSLRDGTLVTANNTLANMLGYDSVDELLTVQLGRDVYLDGDERERLIREYESRGHTFDSELQWKRKDGSPIWVQVSAHAISRVDGAIKCFEGFVRNVTDRKRAEEAQRDSERRFRATFEQSAVGMAITDTDGNFLQVNTALCNYLGYSEAELLKLGVLDITRPQDRSATKRRFSEMKAGNRRVSDHEKGYLRKDGTIVWGHTKVVWVLRSESSYSVAVIQDITERKLAQQALEKFSRRLIEVQETERQNIARELHDEIGQLLTALKIGLETVKRDVPAGEASSRLKESVAVVDEALRLVRDLSLDLHPAMLDDLGLTAALRWYIESYAQRTGIHAALKLDSFDEKKKRVSREFGTTCFRVVQEALTNVARHAHATKASVELRCGDEHLHVTIKDQGCGFDPRLLRKRDAAHVTLGLRGMHERAQAMGGTLEVKSKPSAGTEIHLVLPFSQPKQQSMKTRHVS